MADDALAGFAGRMHQLFPVLTEPEIARVSRFGAVHIYPRGTRLFSAGERAPGVFVVLKGILAISQRDECLNANEFHLKLPTRSWLTLCTPKSRDL